MSSMALPAAPTADPSQGAAPAIPGQAGIIIDPGTGQPVTAGPTVLPPAEQLARNPLLPQHPLGAYTDATYEAQVAQLRATAMKNYNDILQQLGYVNDQGQFVMGSAETAAAQKKSQDDYQEDTARRGVTQDMQRSGTLFSGYRGQQEGQQTLPFEQDKAQLGIDLPNQLSQLYTQAGGVVSDFVNSHNLILADAASRAAAAAAANQTAPVAPVTPVVDPGAGAGAIAPNPNTTQTNAGLPADQQLAGVAPSAPVISAGGTPGGITGAPIVQGALATVTPASGPSHITSGAAPPALASVTPSTPTYDPAAVAAAAAAASHQEFLARQAAQAASGGVHTSGF